MKYIVKSNDLDDYSKIVEDIINNEINPTISIMDKLARKALWKGPARDDFVEVYDNLLNDIKKIPQYLFIYNDFLSKVINNYGDTLEEMKKELEKLEQELELEGKGDLDETDSLL